MTTLAQLYFILAMLSFVLPLTSWARTPHSCYWGINKLAPDDFLPCYGSSTTAQYSCCQTGDKCLEDNACYDSNTGVTYQYGCTDPTFKDLHCPQKCNLDTSKSHWAGLIFCDGSKNLPNDTWVCHHPDNCGNRGTCASQIWGDTIQRLPPTGCEDVKHGREYVALEMIGTIRDLVPLPVSSMTASWWEANADRYKTVVTTSIATPMPVPTTLITMTTIDSSPGSKIPIQSSLTAIPPVPSAAETPKTEPSKPNLKLILPATITPLPFIFGFLFYLIKKILKYMKKRAMENGEHQESDSPTETSAARRAWEYLKNAAHHLWWPFDDIPSDLWKQCNEIGKVVKNAVRKAWDTLIGWCMEQIKAVKTKLNDLDLKKQEENPVQAYDPKLEFERSPAPESPVSFAASEASDLAAPLPLRVVNRGRDSPTPTVQSRRVGVVDSLRLHHVRLAV